MSKRMRLTRADVVAFMRQVPLVAFATASVEGRPEAALVCAAVRDNLEVVIDMADDSRKFLNLQRNVRVALVFGSAGQYVPGKHDERTLQYEGIAEIPSGDELKRARAAYFVTFPAGRDRLTWPHITYVRVLPTWICFSDYNQSPPLVAELGGDKLRRWRMSA